MYDHHHFTCHHYLLTYTVTRDVLLTSLARSNVFGWYVYFGQVTTTITSATKTPLSRVRCGKARAALLFHRILFSSCLLARALT